MNDPQVGWIAAIIVGGLAGWLAEMFMKTGTGIFMNIILGIVGAALANWLLGLLGVSLGGGWISYLIAGFIGAVIIAHQLGAPQTRLDILAVLFITLRIIYIVMYVANLALALFNLLPIPPLDGSKLLYAVFPIKAETQAWLEHYGMFLILFVVLFLSAPISILIQTVLSLFIGLTI